MLRISLLTLQQIKSLSPGVVLEGLKILKILTVKKEFKYITFLCKVFLISSLM